MARHGMAWSGKAWAEFSADRALVTVRFPVATPRGAARPGMAGLGKVWPGKAGQGEAGLGWAGAVYSG